MLLFSLLPLVLSRPKSIQDRILHERSRLNLNDERDRVGLNEKFHDQFHPLSSHLTRKPDSFILEKSLTDIGGPGEKSGKICIYSVFLELERHRLTTLQKEEPLSSRIKGAERIV